MSYSFNPLTGNWGASLLPPGSLASQAEAEDATSTAVRAFSGQRVAQAIAANPRTIKGPHSYSAMLALPTTGFVAGATHVYCNSPAERIGIYVWDGTNYTKENASVVSAERAFGFKPGVDNTAAFAALTNWHKSLARGQHYTVVFGPGDFPADVIEFALPTDGLTPSLILEGVPQQTRFVARQSSHPVFMTVNAGFMWTLRLSGIELRGAGGENPNQDGLAIVGTPRPLDNVGGVTSWEWHELRVTNFAGQACWVRGSQRNNGLFGALVPNQFGFVRNCWFDNPGGRHAFETIGQFGQVCIENGNFDGGGNLTNAGAGLVLSLDYRFQSQSPVYVDTSSGTIGCVQNYYWPHGTPCRLIGTNLPGGLSLGTTYWAWQVDIDGSNASIGNFRLASSLANCGSQTAILPSTTGTYGSYTFIPLWATALSNNTFSTDLPHKLITGDRIRFLGSGLPSGAALATDYYVIRVDHLRWKLASSEVNAAAGTELSMSGGALNNFGFVINDGTVSALMGPYSVDVLDATVQIRRQGVFVANGNDINLRLHVEDLTRSFHIVESVALIDGGSFLKGAADSGKGVWLTATGGTCKVGVTGKPSFSVPPDKLYCIQSGATLDVDQTQPTLMNGSWPGTTSTGYVARINAAATLDVGSYRVLEINASATQIATITSQHTPGQEITLIAYGGSITIVNSGNISMPYASMLVPDKGSVRLSRGDTTSQWVVTSSVPGIGGALGSTDNALLRADGTAGLTAQGSAATLSDTGVLSGVTGILGGEGPSFAFKSTFDGQAVFHASYSIGWSSGGVSLSTVPDLTLSRDASGILAQRGSSQTFRLYNTFTDASNYERGKIEWASNVLRIGTEKAGTGTARALELQTDGTTRLTIGTNGATTFNGDIFVENVKSNNTIRVWGADIKVVIYGSVVCNFFPGVQTYSDNYNISFGTTTGTKIGTGTSQKLGFWNTTPIAQPTTSVSSATVAATGTGDVVAASTTFDGYTIPQIVKALRNAGLLA